MRVLSWPSTIHDTWWSELLVNSDAELTMVTRAIANCCALAMWCTSLPGAVTIRGDQARCDAVLAVDRMARLFKLDLGRRSGTDAIIDPSVSNTSQAHQHHLQEWSARIPDAGRNMVEGALGAYARHFAGHELTQILWTRELFFVNGDSGEGLADVLELSGGARVLGLRAIYPAASWGPGRRESLGWVPAEAARAPFLDRCLRQQPARLHKLSTGRGRSLLGRHQFLVRRADWVPGLEIRVWVASDNARGQLAFGHVVLRPLAMRQLDSVTTTL